MARRDDENCGNCEFYLETRAGQGLCQIDPPVVTPDAVAGVTTNWPRVSDFSWCGKHDYYERTENEIRAIKAALNERTTP